METNYPHNSVEMIDMLHLDYEKYFFCQDLLFSVANYSSSSEESSNQDDNMIEGNISKLDISNEHSS
jgi:hypothetical protein